MDKKEKVKKVLTIAEELKVSRETTAALEEENKQLKLDMAALPVLEKVDGNKPRGKKIDHPMARYLFTQILDPGISFTGTKGLPVYEGGKNQFTRYCCEDNAEIDLPVSYAKELNMCNIPNPKWIKDENGDSKKIHTIKKRWMFSEVGS